MIECSTIYGTKVLREKKDLIFRASAYGFIEDEGKILVAKISSSNKYFVPGGGVEIFNNDKITIKETLEEGLRREIMEETGLEIEVGRHFFFKESFFNYQPKFDPKIDESYYCHCHFYLCKPLTFKLRTQEEIEDQESQVPVWMNPLELKQEECQPLLWDALEFYKNNIYGR